jgi:hypothetical protein
MNRPNDLPAPPKRHQETREPRSEEHDPVPGRPKPNPGPSKLGPKHPEPKLRDGRCPIRRHFVTAASRENSVPTCAGGAVLPNRGLAQRVSSRERRPTPRRRNVPPFHPPKRATLWSIVTVDFRGLIHRRVRNAASPLPASLHPILPWASAPVAVLARRSALSAGSASGKSCQVRPPQNRLLGPAAAAESPFSSPTCSKLRIDLEIGLSSVLVAALARLRSSPRRDVSQCRV